MAGEDEKYSEYYSLNEYERKALVATNYWRVINGKQEIPVPETDLHYKKYFDKRCYKLYQEKLEWEQKKQQEKQQPQQPQNREKPKEPPTEKKGSQMELF